MGGVSYQPVARDFDLGAVLAPHNVVFGDSTFVDLGAGKGRALLLASRLPFRRIIGVEYSRSLVGVAQANLGRLDDSRIELVNADAIDFELPREPLVLFLFNPFDCDLMSELIANVRASYRAEPRRILVVYYTPVCAEQWIQADFVSLVGESGGALIFDTS